MGDGSVDSSEFPYFTCIFRIPGTLKLTQASQPVINLVIQTSERCWKPNLVSHGLDPDGTYEFNFSGCPFVKCCGHDTALQAKRFCCNLLADLYALGWHLQVTSNVSLPADLSTWFFKRMAAIELRRPEMICLSTSAEDSLQLIMAPHSLWPHLKEAVKVSYADMGGIQEVKEFGDDLELKLRGYPWNSPLFQGVIYARKVILAVFRAFDHQHYHFYGTVNMKGTTDCMFFIRDEGQPSNIHEYSILSINCSNKIRMIECSGQVIAAVRNSIIKYWKLQQELDFETAFEFMLDGSPWKAKGKEAVAARLLMTQIFENLLSNGWSVLAALDVSRKENDKSIFILRSCQSMEAPHFCISLNDVNKIRLIKAPQEIALMARKCLLDAWPLGIDSENTQVDSLEFQLNGNPWDSSPSAGNDYLIAHCLLCLLLKWLTDAGSRFICSGDLSSELYRPTQHRSEFWRALHSWFFVRSTTAPVVPPKAEPVPPTQVPWHMSTIPDMPPPSYGKIFKETM